MNAGSLFGEIPEWHDDAACLGSNGDVFFPGLYESARQAKQICAECPVAAECLDYALETNQRYGIWGGTSEKDRQKLRRERRKTA